MHYFVNYEIEWIDGSSSSYAYELEYSGSATGEQDVRNEILYEICRRLPAPENKIPFKISSHAVIDLAQVKMINVDVRTREK